MKSIFLAHFDHHSVQLEYLVLQINTRLYYTKQKILFKNNLIKECRHTSSVRTKRIEECNKEIDEDCKVERHAAPK